MVFAVDSHASHLHETGARAREAGGMIVAHVCDVTDAGAVEAMVAACVQRFGRVDVLLNNVGGSAKGGAVSLAEAVWDEQIAYNLKSVFLTCKFVIPEMDKAGGGAIVNTASTSGIRYTGSPQVASASEHVTATLS